MQTIQTQYSLSQWREDLAVLFELHRHIRMTTNAFIKSSATFSYIFQTKNLRGPFCSLNSNQNLSNKYSPYMTIGST